MNIHFADTSYFLALLIPEDINHAHALACANEQSGKLVSSEYVMLEVGNFLSPQRTRHLLRPFVRALRADRRMTIVNASRTLLDEALDLYASRSDKSWSLVDCSSFVIMQERGIQEALTADHHFEQAGFRALLT